MHSLFDTASRIVIGSICMMIVVTMASPTMMQMLDARES
jgi:hypothetical protein